MRKYCQGWFLVCAQPMKRWRYIVTTSLIGWVQAYNQPDCEWWWPGALAPAHQQAQCCPMIDNISTFQLIITSWYFSWRARDHLNIKMSSYQYRDSHLKEGLVQDCRNSSALAMELLQPCTKPSRWSHNHLIFIMEIPIPGKMVFILRQGPGREYNPLHWDHNGHNTISIVYSTIYSDADQRKYQSSASLAFVRGIHRRLVNSLHKWPVTWKMFPFDDVIMRWQGTPLALFK